MDEFIGIIKLFAGNFAPHGWLFCQGQLLPINQYSAVFAILGTTYGGDGKNTFALPDLRGRVPVGVGAGPGLSNRALGEKAGTETVTLNATQLPAHTHSLSALSAEMTVTIPTYDGANSLSDTSGAGDSGLANGPGAPATMYADKGGGATGNLPAVKATATLAGAVSATGGGQAVPTTPPYLGLNYIICLQGIFPSRD